MRLKTFERLTDQSFMETDVVSILDKLFVVLDLLVLREKPCPKELGSMAIYRRSSALAGRVPLCAAVITGKCDVATLFARARVTLATPLSLVATAGDEWLKRLSWLPFFGSRVLSS